MPPWLLLEKEIEASRALALGTLARWERAEADLRETPNYSQLRAAARKAYHNHLKMTNDLVLKYNYSHPFSFRAPMTVMTKVRLRDFDEHYGADEETQ